jgi:GcrA cell cycle regulator
MSHPWDIPGLNTRLCELHAEGLPFSVIADQLNAEFGTTLTRYACIGRAHRLQLPIRPPSPAREAKPAKRVPVGAPIMPRLPIIRVGPEGIPFAALGYGNCRWPYGAWHEQAKLFCGRPVCESGGPWCARHYRKAYNKGPAA